MHRLARVGRPELRQDFTVTAVRSARSLPPTRNLDTHALPTGRVDVQVDRLALGSSVNGPFLKRPHMNAGPLPAELGRFDDLMFHAAPATTSDSDDAEQPNNDDDVFHSDLPEMV